MEIKATVKSIWQRLANVQSGGTSDEAAKSERRTAMLPSILSPYNPAARMGQSVLPKPTPATCASSRRRQLSVARSTS
jgi:hypothetical protein